MQFDLKDLRLFVLIAQTGSLTRAAEQSHLSLAATSARAKALEEQAGMPLLIREARGVRLSPPGEAFLHHAQAMLQQSRQLQADLQEYGAGLRGHLRVFANTTAVTDFLPDILSAYLIAHPHIAALRLPEGSGRQAAERGRASPADSHHGGDVYKRRSAGAARGCAAQGDGCQPAAVLFASLPRHYAH